MNYVIDQLEELMFSIQHHGITFIVFTVIALLYPEAILYNIYRLVEPDPRHDMRKKQNSLTDGHNKLASRLLEQEQN